MTRATPYLNFLLILGGLWAILVLTPTTACASSDEPHQGLQVYWYDSIGDQRSLNGVDWSAPDRMTRAGSINWPSTSAPWEPGAPRDRFAVRILGTLRAHAPGQYRFRLGSDDGSRLYINDELLIDNDGLHSMRYRENPIDLEAGHHPIEVLFFERTGGAGLHLEWRPPGQSSWSTVPPTSFAEIDATIEVDWYFEDGAISRLEDIDWANPDLTTNETQINWPDRSGSGFIPDSPDERFALRARTRLIVPESGMYRFELGSDDGSRLRIGGETIIDQNRLQSFHWEPREIYLTQGAKDLEVLFFENSGSAGLVLMWQGPSDPAPTVIPADAFESPAGTALPRVTRWTEQPRLRAEREPLN